MASKRAATKRAARLDVLPRVAGGPAGMADRIRFSSVALRLPPFGGFALSSECGRPVSPRRPLLFRSARLKQAPFQSPAASCAEQAEGLQGSEFGRAACDSVPSEGDGRIRKRCRDSGNVFRSGVGEGEGSERLLQDPSSLPAPARAGPASCRREDRAPPRAIRKPPASGAPLPRIVRDAGATAPSRCAASQFPHPGLPSRPGMKETVCVPESSAFW